MESVNYDAIVIGTGAGGGTIAKALAEKGVKLLIVERGGFLPREKENWEAAALFQQGRYNCKEFWIDAEGRPFEPGTHYYVGGNTKFYGAALLRLRECDFQEIRHAEGLSPAWPLSYQDFRPYYQKAEELFHVHGARGRDPTEPPESHAYPHPPVSHEPQIQKIFDRLKGEGLKPFPLPLGVRLNEKEPEKSLCIRCDTCDGFPCLTNAKSDAHHLCIEPIRSLPNVHLLTHAKALRLLPTERGDAIAAVEVEHQGQIQRFTAKTFIVSCGAINSAALLLRSTSPRFPNGLANSSGLVGRHYMCHNNSAIVALSLEKNTTLFQKTIGINDFYHRADDFPYPLGHIQLLGKVKWEMLAADAPLFAPSPLLRQMADHAVGWWITSEDLPLPDNRVLVDQEGRLHLRYTPNNLTAHKKLLQKLKWILRKTGHFHHFPNAAYLSKKIPLAGVAHQVGTLRFGTDPRSSVLDLHCKAHDLDNLYVVDGSFFPSSGAVNPALTIIANAIRVGEHLLRTV